MNRNLLRFGLLCLVLLVSVVTKAGDFRDIKLDLAGGSLFTADEMSTQSATSFGVSIATDGSATRVAADATDANAVISCKYHDNQHGVTNFKATVPVTGPVKITMGNCTYGSTATVKDAQGTTIGTINVKEAGNCWHGNKTTNVTSCLYKGTEATTLTIEGGGYVPYLAVEAVNAADLASDITLTYSLGTTTAEGTLPASAKVEVGSSYTLPVNTTLYLAGCTLTGWTDGTNTYKPGETITAPSASATLTPVFKANTKSLADRTEATSLTYYFGHKNGAQDINYQGKKGILVTQATVDGETIDVKIDLDGTPSGAKFNNAGRVDEWAQMNANGIITVPSCKGATIEMAAYGNITTTTIDGQAEYTSGKVISQTIASSAETVNIVIGDGSFYSYLKITLPVVASKPAGKTFNNEAANVVFAMNDLSNASVNTTAPTDAFSTIAFDYGANLSLKGILEITKADGTASGIKGLKINNDSGTKQTELNWLVRPAAGLTFTPTKVSGYVNRCGTNVENGIVISAHKANGEVVALGTYTAWRQGKATSDQTYDNTAIHQFEITLTAEQQAALAGTDGFYLTSTIGVNPGKQAVFGPVTIEGTVNGTLVAVNKYKLSAVTNPEGIADVTVYPKSDEYQENDEVTLTAADKFGYNFVNWTDKNGTVLSTESKFKYTVTEDQTLTANYKKVKTYALDVNVEGGAKDYMVTLSPAPEMVDGKKMYEEGTEVTLTATGNDIIDFNNWSNGETTAEIKTTMNADQAFTATFSAKDYIVAWDFYQEGKEGRTADFAAADNDAVQLVLRDAEGNSYGWLDKSNKAGGYEGKNAAVNWTKTSTKALGDTYWQTKFNATAFTDIKVKSSMLYNYNAYETYNVEYSLDGEKWTQIGAITMPGAKAWTAGEFTLPADANNQAAVYVRWIADKTSSVKGTTGTNDGIALAQIYITGTAKLFDDGTAPVLQSQVPAAGATNASANGKIVLTFDEKVKLTESAKATLNGQELTGTVSGKTITFAYKGLSYATEYTFALAAGSVADLTDNAIQSDITFSFTTKEKPAVTKALYDFIVPTDGSFTEALAAAAKRTDTSKRFRIFIKQGDYKIPANPNSMVTGIDGKQYPSATTYMNTPNVSIIGESNENTSITNTVPAVESSNGYNIANVLEGIGRGDVLSLESGATNTYFQDIKMYSSMGDGKGRDIVLNDKSNKTICKNVNLWAYQDTYVSNNQRGRFYFEGGILRGNTDYLCGKGDVYYNNVDLLMCGTGYLAVPSQPTKYGYIFKDCTIKDGSSTGINGKYKLGRPWGKGTPIALFIDTKMEVIPTAAGWDEMSGGYPKRFAEYNSTTATGTAVDLSGRKQVYDAYDAKDGDNYTNRRNETAENPVLTAEEAASYTIETVMGADDDWDPTAATEQASAPTNVKIAGNNLTWDNSNYALLWAVCKNGKVVDFTVEPSYNVDDASATWSVRAANEMGGLGEATIASTSTGIENISTSSDVLNTKIYSADGVQASKLQRGINIVVKTMADGSKKTNKVVLK